MNIQKFQFELKTKWDEFAKAQSSFFFFQRDFMEYHKDRFEDHSLLIYKDNDLVAILPASTKNSTLVCHGGLTFGFLVSSETRYVAHKEMWDAIEAYCKTQGILEVVYKKPPQFFSINGQDNDTYELARRGATRLKAELTSYIDFTDYRYSKGRKSSVTKSTRQELAFNLDSDCWSDYFKVLSEVLMAGHGVSATHTLQEMLSLKKKFPQNIILAIVEKDDAIVAGAILFLFGSVVHTQYLAVTEAGRSLCAMDFLMHSIIEHYKSTCRGVSFGISTEQGGKTINEGLVLQKESYGAKNFLINTYNLKLI